MARKKSPVEEEADLDMTPMIDVTFQLLIFFIITLKFRTLEKKLLSYLPTDFGLNSSSEPIDELFVTVKLRQPPKSEAGSDWRSSKLTKIYLNDEKLEGTVRENLNAIASRLETFRAQQVEIKGKIDAGAGVPHKHVVTMLDLFSRARYSSVTFVGLSKNFNIVKSDEWWNKVQQKLAE
ncbi:MAG: biopolymer transporter ExbD [Planctomycetota bacterium]